MSIGVEKMTLPEEMEIAADFAGLEADEVSLRKGERRIHALAYFVPQHRG